MRFEPLLEKNMLPDFIIRWGARRLTGRRFKQITSQSVEGHRANFMEYVEDLRTRQRDRNTVL